MVDVASQLAEVGWQAGLEFFAAELRNARIGRGLTQTEVGERIGVSSQSVHNWESGAVLPDGAHQERLAELFDLDVESWPSYFQELLREKVITRFTPRRPLPGRLRQARRESGLKQQEVADALQVSRNAISRYERGATAPSHRILRELAEQYAKPLTWFYETNSSAPDSPETGLTQERAQAVLDWVAEELSAMSDAEITAFFDRMRRNALGARLHAF